MVGFIKRVAKCKSSRLYMLSEKKTFDVLPIISLQQMMTPLDFPSLDHMMMDMVGRIHKKTIHCYTQK